MKFYDPGFAVGTAVLSVISWPVWILALDDAQAGIIFGAVFSVGVLALMLFASWQIAQDCRRLGGVS